MYKEESGWKFMFKVAGVTVLVFAFGIALLAGIFSLRVATAGLVGRGNAHIEIQSANHRIPTYNHFFDLCASVQNAESTIDAQTVALDQIDASDTFNKGRIQQVIAVARSVRANGINQYNADAAKDYTEAMFLDSDLPYRLSLTDYVAGGAKTKCAG